MPGTRSAIGDEMDSMAEKSAALGPVREKHLPVVLPASKRA